MIIGIDLGTSTGWAANTNGVPSYGCEKLRKSGRMESPGMRPIRFRALLTKLIEKFGDDKTLFIFEEVRAHKGSDAAHVYGELRGVLYEFCDVNGFQYTSLPVSEIKKFATGRGNASKEMMIEAANKAWPSIGLVQKDDDIADALWVMTLGAEKEGTRSERVRTHVPTIEKRNVPKAHQSFMPRRKGGRRQLS